ncbi:MAG: hypothetical protein GY711_20390 [bacterium]|nr:hypothetical protein [bacterium]
MTGLLVDLESWFASHCDGDWEHGWGVRINTLDTPGWSVDIDLAGTALSRQALSRIQEEREEHDWIHCWVDGEPLMSESAMRLQSIGVPSMSLWRGFKVR